MTMSKFAKIMLGAALLPGTIIQVQADDKKVDPIRHLQWVMAGPQRRTGPDELTSR